MAEEVITIDPISPDEKDGNLNWISQAILTVSSFDPTSLKIYINSFGSRPYDMEVYIEEDKSDVRQPYPDQTGHILYSGTIPQADLNAQVDEYFQFTVTLTGTTRLLIGQYYHIVTWAQDPSLSYRFRVRGVNTGTTEIRASASSGNDPTLRSWVSSDPNDIAFELFGDNVVGPLVATSGELWVKNEQLHYGDGEGYERYFDGDDVAEAGTAGKIGYESGGTVLRYTSKTGKIREVGLQDTGDDDTVGKVGYESAGRRLRFVDAGGKKREAEGMLI